MERVEATMSLLSATVVLLSVLAIARSEIEAVMSESLATNVHNPTIRSHTMKIRRTKS